MHQKVDSDPGPSLPQGVGGPIFCGVERRKTTRKSITQILDKMQDIADTCYNGDLTTYVNEIFEELEADDQLTFLRSSVTAHLSASLARAKAGHDIIRVNDRIEIDPTAVDQEAKDIDRNSNTEQIKVSAWLVKMTFVVTFIILILIIGYSAVTTSENETIIDAREMISEVLKVMLVD